MDSAWASVLPWQAMRAVKMQHLHRRTLRAARQKETSRSAFSPNAFVIRFHERLIAGGIAHGKRACFRGRRTVCDK